LANEAFSVTVPSVFETSNGRSIPILDGYYDAHKVKAQVFHAEHQSDGKTPLVDRSLKARIRRNLSASGVKRQVGRIPRTLLRKANGSYLKDAFEYGLVVDYLSSIGCGGPWDRLLDIGGAEGYIARLFKAEGRAKSAVCVDVVQNATTNAEMWMHHYQYKRTKILNGRKALLKKLPNYFGYYPPSSGAYLNIKFKETPAIEEHVVGSALSVSGRFDLVTAFLCLEYFDLDEIFPKVQALLDDNGVFAMLVNYWWWPVNSTAIVGQFPYAAQRLSESDFHRYVSLFHSDLAEEYTRRYSYYHKGKQRPTVQDYLDAGRKHGLEPCGYLRLMPRRGGEPKTPLAPAVLGRMEGFRYADVLDDIACFRSGVTEIDLKTAYALCVFEKR
jgi:hypothetical protein